jgi:hypothetical protein
LKQLESGIVVALRLDYVSQKYLGICVPCRISPLVQGRSKIGDWHRRRGPTAWRNTTAETWVPGESADGNAKYLYGSTLLNTPGFAIYRLLSPQCKSLLPSTHTGRQLLVFGSNQKIN